MRLALRLGRDRSRREHAQKDEVTAWQLRPVMLVRVQVKVTHNRGYLPLQPQTDAEGSRSAGVEIVASHYAADHAGRRSDVSAWVRPVRVIEYVECADP